MGTTYVIAGNPLSGAPRLTRALADTGVLGNPVGGIHPLAWHATIRRSQDANFHDWLSQRRQLATTDNGVLGISTMWLSWRWLLEMTRALHPDDGVTDRQLTDEIVTDAVWIRLRRDDPAAEAIEWARRLNPGDESPDDAQVQWLATLAVEHSQRWQDFFARCEISAVDVSYEDVVSDLPGVVSRVAELVGA